MIRNVLLYLVVILLGFLSIYVTSQEVIYAEPESHSMKFILKSGRIDGFHKKIYVASIDGGKTWLLVTPTMEVEGYVHKVLPHADISMFKKLERKPNGPHFKFYYRDL